MFSREATTSPNGRASKRRNGNGGVYGGVDGRGSVSQTPTPKLTIVNMAHLTEGTVITLITFAHCPRSSLIIFLSYFLYL